MLTKSTASTIALALVALNAASSVSAHPLMADLVTNANIDEGSLNSRDLRTVHLAARGDKSSQSMPTPTPGPRPNSKPPQPPQNKPDSGKTPPPGPNPDKKTENKSRPGTNPHPGPRPSTDKMPSREHEQKIHNRPGQNLDNGFPGPNNWPGAGNDGNFGYGGRYGAYGGRYGGGDEGSNRGGYGGRAGGGNSDYTGNYQPERYGGYQPERYGGYQPEGYGGYPGRHRQERYGGYQQERYGGYQQERYGGYQPEQYGAPQAEQYGGRRPERFESYNTFGGYPYPPFQPGPDTQQPRMGQDSQKPQNGQKVENSQKPKANKREIELEERGFKPGEQPNTHFEPGHMYIMGSNNDPSDKTHSRYIRELWDGEVRDEWSARRDLAHVASVVARELAEQEDGSGLHERDVGDDMEVRDLDELDARELEDLLESRSYYDDLDALD
ncbi:hypothetical protein HGRIS_007217 [Hohenbuehelia grisea]|uniref:Uncharacterized protein n=1 Tax=Hohenbuehelia grisea TaxID=104357 RepID=A0ABR3JBE9_9AGAR